MVIAPTLGQLTARQETSVLRGITLGMIQLTSALIAIVLTVYMIPNEIDRRTIYTILSKPVQRWQFLVGKYLGAVLALAMMIGLMTLVLIVVVAAQQMQTSGLDLNQLMPFGKIGVMFLIQMSLLAAVGLMFSTFVAPLVNFFLTAGMYLLGTLFNPFFETVMKSPSASPVSKTIGSILNTVLPNFANYNVQNPLINPGQEIQNENWYYAQSAVYGIVYIGALIIVAMLVFDKREV